MLTDAQLVELAIGGSEEGFRALVARHQRSVYNLLARMLRNPGLAEELAQETFLKAYSHLRTFDPRYKFSNWILRIAHNAAIDAMRRRLPQELSMAEVNVRGEARLEEVLADPTSDDGVKAVERRDLRRLIEAALDRLRPEYRQAIVLRYQEDLSYEEIAEITGLPVGTVKSNLHRARREMAGHLERQGLKPQG